MVENLIRVTEMMGENRWCINRAKDKTIFEKDGQEYYIYWVKEYRVKLINIETDVETEWIPVNDFQKQYRETDYCISA